VFTAVRDDSSTSRALLALGEATLAAGDPAQAAAYRDRARILCPPDVDQALRALIDTVGTTGQETA
jgi:hypothetical protein